MVQLPSAPYRALVEDVGPDELINDALTQQREDSHRQIQKGDIVQFKQRTSAAREHRVATTAETVTLRSRYSPHRSRASEVRRVGVQSLAQFGSVGVAAFPSAVLRDSEFLFPTVPMSNDERPTRRQAAPTHAVGGPWRAEAFVPTRTLWDRVSRPCVLSR